MSKEREFRSIEGEVKMRLVVSPFVVNMMMIDSAEGDILPSLVDVGVSTLL